MSDSEQRWGDRSQLRRCLQRNGSMFLAASLVLTWVATPPNVVLVLVDDLGWQDTSLGFSVNPKVVGRHFRTPNLEALAKRRSGQPSVFNESRLRSVPDDRLRSEVGDVDFRGRDKCRNRSRLARQRSMANGHHAVNPRKGTRDLQFPCWVPRALGSRKGEECEWKDQPEIWLSLVQEESPGGPS